MKYAIKHILDIVVSKTGNVTLWDILIKTNLFDNNLYYDRLTELIFKKVLKDSSVCVDVGCHQGYILQMMMKYAPNGKFYAFEPLPHLFEELKSCYANYQNVTIYDIALSDTTGNSDFNYVITNPGYSGFIKRRYDRPNEKDITITVKTDKMDNLVVDVNVDLIKIDVEGAELQVLRGAKRIIKKNKPFIIFEHGLGVADCYGTRPEEVYDFLFGCCGLKINLLNRYLKNMSPLSKMQFCKQFYQGLNYYFIAFDS